MGNINDLLKKRLEARKQPTTSQSKSSSLMMNALKSSMAIILDTRPMHDEDTSFMNSVAVAIKKTFEQQAGLVDKIANVKGGLTQEESFIWRRTFNISASGLHDGKSPHENIILAILSNTSQSRSICSRLGVDQTQLTNLITSISRYNLYTESNTFFSTTHSSLMTATAKIDKALYLFDWGISAQYMREISFKACSLTTSDIMELGPDFLNTKQKVMFQKACIGHSAKLVSAALRKVGREWNYQVPDFRISEFEEQFVAELDLLKNCLKYCAKKVRDSLADFEEKHAQTALSLGNTDLSVSDLLNAIDSIQHILPKYIPETPNTVFARQFINTLNSSHFFTEYITRNIDQYITNIVGDAQKSFSYNTVYNALLGPLRTIHFGDLDIDERYLKMCANISIYLISEQSPINPALNDNGLMPEQIQSFRNERDMAFAIGISNPFQNRQIIIPAVAEITKAYASTLCFNWGINLAHIAPQIGKAILKATSRSYLETAEKVTATNTTIYRACLSDVTQCFIDTWVTESENTLNNSKQRYTRGDITAEDSQLIVDSIIEKFNTASQLRSYSTAYLSRCISETVDLEDIDAPATTNEFKPEALL